MIKIITILSAVALVGCASTHGTTYVPVVDLKGRNVGQYQQDLSECQSLSQQRDDTAGSAAAGAIAAGLLGAILAPSGYRNNVAGRAALIGAAGGAGQAIETQQNIIKRCLANRGYSVLN